MSRLRRIAPRTALAAWIASAALLAIACDEGLGQEAFADDFPPIYCALAFDCDEDPAANVLGATDADACEEELSSFLGDTGGEDGNCHYDAAVAESLLDDVRAATCVEFEADPEAFRFSQAFRCELID